MSGYFAKIAFLKYLQNENGCPRTGVPCREKHTCGCSLEMEDYIEIEMHDHVSAATERNDG